MKSRYIVSFAYLLIMTATCLGQSSSRDFHATQPTEIVERIRWNGLTLGIPATPLFKPTTSGIFRVSLYLNLVTPSPLDQNQSLCSTLSWHDDSPNLIKFNGACIFTNDSFTTVTPFATAVIFAKAHEAVQLSTQLSGKVDQFTYDVIVVVEELGTHSH